MGVSEPGRSYRASTKSAFTPATGLAKIPQRLVKPVLVRKGTDMRHWVLTLATAAVLAAPAAAQTEWANKLFEETSKDFGTCPRGAQLKHSFKMTNIYKVPLEFTDVTPKCNCVTCTLTHKVLQPNEPGYLNIVMDGTRFTGHKAVNIQVRVGPQFVSTATVTVQAVARQDVTFNPGSVNFGVVARGQTPTQTIEVEYAG